MKDFLLFALFLAGIDEKTAAEYLGLKRKEVKAYYKEFLSLSRVDILEKIYSEPDPDNRKFLLMCLHGKEKFVRHFLGIERMDDKELFSLAAIVEPDINSSVRLRKLALEIEKFELQKKKSGDDADKELLDTLRSLGNIIFSEDA